MADARIGWYYPNADLSEVRARNRDYFHVALDVHPLIRAHRAARFPDTAADARNGAYPHDSYCRWTWPHPGQPCQFRDHQ